MSEHTPVPNMLTAATHRPLLKKNDTMVKFENDEQAAAAMVENYKLNSRVWFDNCTRQWPWMGSFQQTFTNLPSGSEERRRFASLVAATFHELFPVQRVYVYDTYVLVLADGESTRQPQNWDEYVL